MGDDYPYIEDPEQEASLLLNATFRCNSTMDNCTHPPFEDYSDALFLERTLAIIVPILFGVIFIVGLLGNALVVVVVLCNQQMRSPTNLLILNLASADLMFIVFCVPFTAWDYAFNYWPFGDVWCRIMQYLVFVCAYSSIYTLVLMSLDRFLAVVHPITSMSIRTERYTCYAILLTWCVILASCAPLIEAHGQLDYVFALRPRSVCTFLSPKGYNLTAFQICFFLSSYVIPLSLVFVLYMLMLKRLWFGVAPGGRMSIESVRSKKRVTRLVVVVVLIFAVCWCPIQIILVLKSLEAFDITVTLISVQIAAQILAYMNSCVNPILYAFLSDNFRKAFRKVIVCYPQRYALSRDHEITCATTKNTKCNNDIL